MTAISRSVAEANSQSAVRLRRLKKAEYVSPQGVPFMCGTCRFYDNRAPGILGYCHLKEVEAIVEEEGCCDYWTSPEGVHG